MISRSQKKRSTARSKGGLFTCLRNRRFHRPSWSKMSFKNSDLAFLKIQRLLAPPAHLNYCIKITVLGDLCFFVEAEKPKFKNVLKWQKSTRLRQHTARSPILEVRHICIFGVSAMPSSTGDFVEMIFAFSTPTPFSLT